MYYNFTPPGDANYIICAFIEKYYIISVGRSILKENLLTDYQCTPSARTMECAGRSVLYRMCVFCT